MDIRGKTPIIAGDFNAWAVEWGSTLTNKRGRLVLESFSPLNLVLINTGNRSTFPGVAGRSIVDLTFVYIYIFIEFSADVFRDFSGISAWV